MAAILDMDQRDWSDGLPQELLHFISKKLCEITNFIRFRVVCKTWRLSSLTSDPPPQLPWLFDSQKKNGKYENLRFYSIASSKIYNFATPSNLRSLYRTASGYMLAYGCSCIVGGITLVNPITNDRVDLPALNIKCPSPLWMSSNPLRSKDYVVVASGIQYGKRIVISDLVYMLAFCRLGDDKWTYMKWPLDMGSYYRSAIYKGKYFIMKYNTAIKAFDIATATLAYVIPPFDDNEFSSNYLIDSSGDLLRIDKCKDESSRKYIFNIYKLDVEKRKNVGPMWIKIDNIGDQMLFLGIMNGLSITETEFAGFRGNCIYYLDVEDDNTRYHFENRPRHLYRYNIEDQTTEELDCPIKASTWFIHFSISFHLDGAGVPNIKLTPLFFAHILILPNHVNYFSHEV